MGGAHGFDKDMVVGRCLDGHGGNGWMVALRYLWADKANCGGGREIACREWNGVDEEKKRVDIA